MQTQNQNQNIIETVKSLSGIEAKKDFLRKISDNLRAAQLVDIELLQFSINELIIKIYQANGATTLKTFEGWKDSGRKVKKGAKALIIWSSKKTKETKDDNDNQIVEYKFFGVAHLFDFSDTEEI